ncbi:hypothetical protein PHMEG_00031025 [Phytophthora megakarya]|uniref:Uncharacterized protein n=1 Tax=Phytophthora megakarya TaxID=4795 RepID=A0A225UZK2_9STRA|nr:hypothetical protein PHMEG_00031025 [Phytophthora megakarya]
MDMHVMSTSSSNTAVARGKTRQTFLETCGDRDLERQLTPMQLRDIRTLEDIVSDIQKVGKRVPSRSSCPIQVGPMGATTAKVGLKREVAGIRATHHERPNECSNDYSKDDPIDFYEGEEHVHDFGKCEAFDELAKILRTNVDKKNTNPELQKLVFGGHLN